MRGRHKKWAEPFLLAHPETVMNEIAAADSFFSSQPLYLEIGCGKGDFVLAMSAKQPGHYLAIERDPSIIAIAASKAVAAKNGEIRFAFGEFDFFFEGLSRLSFQAIYLNFSDPWPKKRHWKRRLTAAPRLIQMASLLSDGGRIYMKTDNDGLFAFTLESYPASGLTLESQEEDYPGDQISDAMSEYEKNFRALGKKIHRIVLVKQGSDVINP